MENKSLIDSLKNSFKKGFQKRIKKAKTLENVIALLEEKEKKLISKINTIEDSKEIKRAESQLAILELQVSKAREQMKVSQKEINDAKNGDS